MKYSLKNQYKNLLNEDVVSIIRPPEFKDELYDVVFDASGNITSGNKYDDTTISDNKDLVNSLYVVARNYSSISLSELIHLINEIGINNFRKTFSTPSEVVSHLNRRFKPFAIGKNKKADRIGIGELAVHMGLNTTNYNTDDEPDAIMTDGSTQTIKISIKNVSDDSGLARGSVRTGEAAAMKKIFTHALSVLNNKLIALGFSEKEFKFPDKITKRRFSSKIENILNSTDSSHTVVKKKQALVDIKQFIDFVKVEMFKENDANSIIVWTGNNFLELTNPNIISIQSYEYGRFTFNHLGAYRSLSAPTYDDSNKLIPPTDEERAVAIQQQTGSTRHTLTSIRNLFKNQARDLCVELLKPKGTVQNITDKIDNFANSSTISRSLKRAFDRRDFSNDAILITKNKFFDGNQLIDYIVGCLAGTESLSQAEIGGMFDPSGKNGKDISLFYLNKGLDLDTPMTRLVNYIRDEHGCDLLASTQPARTNAFHEWLHSAFNLEKDQKNKVMSLKTIPYDFEDAKDWEEIVVSALSNLYNPFDSRRSFGTQMPDRAQGYRRFRTNLTQNKDFEVPKDSKDEEDSEEEIESESLVEGGKAGHMMHPYENLHMKISDMKRMIEDFQNDFEISEKVDGANLFFTIDPQQGKILFSRNKSDMSHEETLEKFGPDHPAHVLFTDGANAIFNSVRNSLSKQDIQRVFGQNPEGGKTYINFEIMHPQKPNQIKYDMKYIVFHAIVDYDINGSVVASSPDDERLIHLLDQLQPSFNVENNDFSLGSNLKIKLNNLSQSDIDELLNELNSITSSLSLSDDMTIADAVKSEIRSLLDRENITALLPEDKIEMIYDFITNESSEVKGTAIKKGLDRELQKTLTALGLTSKAKAYKIIKQIIQEFRPLFILLGIKLLHNVQSRYMSSDASNKNVDELRRLLNAAMEDYDNMMQAEDLSDVESKIVKTLTPHIANVRHHGVDRVVSSPVEGGVFIGKDGNTYKVTGGFAPLNQILGTAMRSLDYMPAFKEEFIAQERGS